MNKALVTGASGATGKRVVAALLRRNIHVVAIVREGSSLRDMVGNHANYSEVTADISQLSEREVAAHLVGCGVVISCLGHKPTFKGLFGEPRRLVTDTLKKLISAVERVEPDHKVKLILMNTSGNSNRDMPENPPFSQRFVISIVRFLLPPHRDNELAADYLRTQIGQNHPIIEWVAVRPDSLINESEASAYRIFPSPIRNVIFNPGTTSRENVAHFMASLAVDPDLWSVWKGKMPVIYNDAG